MGDDKDLLEAPDEEVIELDENDLEEDEFSVDPAPETGSEATDAANAAKDEAKAAREEARRDRGRDHEAVVGLREQIAELQRQVNIPAAAPPAVPERDELSEEIASVKKHQRSLAEKLHTGKDWTPDELGTMATEAENLDERLQELRVDKRLQKKGIKPPPTAEEQRSSALAAQYPDVYGDENALTYARGLFAKYRAQGRPKSRELHDQVIAEVRTDLGLSKKPAPTDTDKRRMVGNNKGNATAPRRKKRTIKMTDIHKGMADSLYRDTIPDQQDRYKKWAAGPGRRMLDKGQLT